jgi:cytochrome P450
MQPGDYKPLDPKVRSNPYPYYQALREQAPVHYVEQLKAYALSRYEDVQAVLKNPAVFSSSREHFTQSNALLDLSKMGEEMKRMMRSSMLVNVDPPQHARMRSLVTRAFSARRVADMEPHIRELTRRLLEGLPRQGEFELLEALSVPLPVTVIAEMLGVEPERLQDFRRWSNDMVNAGTLLLSRPGPHPELEASLREFREYLEGVISRRRVEPRDDLITALLRSGEQEGLLDAEQVMSFVRLLLIAGNETTTNLLGNGMIALVRNPEQLARLRERPELVPNAVEEMLRYDSPAQGLFRFSLRESEFSGHEVPARSMVLVLLGAANRDERRFTEPERFDVEREQVGHIAFGYGIHFCLGAALSRLEMRVVLEELLPRLKHLAFASDQPPEVEWTDNVFLRGPRRLRLAVELG